MKETGNPNQRKVAEPPHRMAQLGQGFPLRHGLMNPDFANPEAKECKPGRQRTGRARDGKGILPAWVEIPEDGRSVPLTGTWAVAHLRIPFRRGCRYGEAVEGETCHRWAPKRNQMYKKGDLGMGMKVEHGDIRILVPRSSKKTIARPAKGMQYFWLVWTDP